MDYSVSVADAKARLSEILDRVEAGEEVVITRRGKAVARLRREDQGGHAEIDLERLRAFRESLPRSKVGAVELVRKLREEARY